MTFNYQDGDDYGNYSDNVDGDNDLCDKVICNIFNHQLLKECGITRHSNAKINLEKKNKKTSWLRCFTLLIRDNPKQAFIILHLQTKNVGEKYKRFAIECRSCSFTEYLFYLFYAVQHWVSPDELAFL